MTESRPNRRHVLATGLAGALGTLTGFGAGNAALAMPIFPRPFAGSRTISSFAEGFFFSEDVMPFGLRRAIEAELARGDVPPDSDAEERVRAEFFAWLAVRLIAPGYLRRAGYDHLAADCEKQTVLWNGMLTSATAQHTIGKQYAYSSKPRLASFAYGASAHTSTTAFYAGHEDIDVVVQTGHYCARALLEGFSYEDTESTEAAAIWDFAARTINMALSVSSGGNAQHGLNLQTPA